MAKKTKLDEYVERLRMELDEARKAHDASYKYIEGILYSLSIAQAMQKTKKEPIPEVNDDGH